MPIFSPMALVIGRFEIGTQATITYWVLAFAGTAGLHG